MVLLYIIIFIVLVLFSAFFSSAETSLLSLDKIKLNLKAEKKNKKAILLSKILEYPEQFFSTILIGNNFVNIAAASISTVVFAHLISAGEQVTMLVSTVVTTTVILFFAEIVPKSYAFRYNEKMSFLYAYPIKFFAFLFYPFVRVTTFFSNLLFKKAPDETDEGEYTLEEVKHYLATQINLFKYDQESLRMVTEIIDIAEKDIKSIMTPRLGIVAIPENAHIEEVKNIILGKKIFKIPVYRESLDHITGIVHPNDLLATLLITGRSFNELEIKKIQRAPIFVSEYSSLKYVLKQFKKHKLNIAVILDEYGSTIGIVTLSDILREIMGDIKLGHPPIRKIGKNTYQIKGNVPVEDVNDQLRINLPEKIDFTTISGLFIYYFGKFPKENSKIKINEYRLMVKRMGKRKIDEIQLINEEK
jgi:putative hemolysin